MVQRTRARQQKRQSALVGYTERLGSALGRHRAEVALNAARIDAESANRAKSEFLANMSHELRTPLNAILGFSEVIGNPDLMVNKADQLSEYAEYIHESATHLLALINDILDISKIEYGKMELRCEVVDINELISSCIILVKERAAKSGVTIVRQDLSNPPPLYVDAIKVKQILTNLLSNSVKFTPSGGTVTVASRMTGNQRLKISVRDTGIGMNEDQLETALEAFGQVDSKLSRRYQGSGLGLPLSRALAELHGARFRVMSQPDVGTDVSVTFPASRTSDAPT
jgi:signal transduction histidine kinase